MWRFVWPALDFLLWQPVRLSDAVVNAMHRRNIAPRLYRDKSAPLRRLHFRLVKIWSPFYRAKPNAAMNESRKTENGQAMALSLESWLGALQDIRRMAWHCIPHYAYGDNEAACDMANRLEWIEQHVEELTAQVVAEADKLRDASSPNFKGSHAEVVSSA